MANVTRPTLTVGDAVDLVDEALVGELRCQGSERVHVTVQKQQRVEHGQDLSLAACKLPLHPQHHVGHVLQITSNHGDQGGVSTNMRYYCGRCVKKKNDEKQTSLDERKLLLALLLTRAHSPFP